MQLPEFPSFKNLTLEDKPFLDSLLGDMQPQVSELTFTSLFVQNSSEPVQLSRVGETVLLQRKRLGDGRTFMLPPLGKQLLINVVKILKRANFPNYQLGPLYEVTRDKA